MSQAGSLSTQASPSVPTSFTTDDGSAIPVANTLVLKARDTLKNDEDGIQTVADPDGDANLYVELTNRVQVSSAETGVGPANITLIDFSAAPLSGTAGVYNLDIRISAYESTTPMGGAYNIFAGIRTDGTTPVVIGDIDKVVKEDASMAAANVDLVIVGNVLMLEVTGIAGKTIQWDAVGEYTRST